jgi:hypothetical protein
MGIGRSNFAARSAVNQKPIDTSPRAVDIYLRDGGLYQPEGLGDLALARRGIRLRAGFVIL